MGIREEMYPLADDSAGVIFCDFAHYPWVPACMLIWAVAWAHAGFRYLYLCSCMCVPGACLRVCVCGHGLCVGARALCASSSLLDSICCSGYWFCFLGLQLVSIDCIRGASFGSAYSWRSFANCGSWISICYWLSRFNLLCNHLIVIMVHLVSLWL